MYAQNRANNVAPFICKLANILEVFVESIQDNESQNIVRWIDTENGFEIQDINNFVDVVMKNILNIKIIHLLQGNLIWKNAFQHPHFTRGDERGFKKICKKVSVQQKYQKQEQIVKNISKTDRKIRKIKQHQAMLQQKFKQMLKSNEKVFKNNMQIVKNVSQQDRAQQKIMGNIYKMLKLKTPTALKQIQNEQQNQMKNCIEMLQKKLKISNTPINSSLYPQITNFIEINQFIQIGNLSLQFRHHSYH